MKTQLPVLVGAAGLIAAAIFVVVPLTSEETTSPGISVGEQTRTPAPAGGGVDAEADETSAGEIGRASCRERV